MKQYIIFSFILLQSFASFGQCNLDQHSTTWYDSWISCTTKTSPNVSRGSSHWIMYNLGYNYALGDSHWWNGNEPSNIKNGIKKIAVDVSQDGTTWTQALIFDLPIATGENSYEGFTGPNFDKVSAKYILLTALENHGGDCYSFGEMKINVDLISNTFDEPTNDICIDLKAYPNPFQSNTTITINSNCNSTLKSILVVEDIYGRIIFKKPIQAGNSNIEFNGSSLISGVYLIKIMNGKSMIQKKLIKVE